MHRHEECLHCQLYQKLWWMLSLSFQTWHNRETLLHQNMSFPFTWPVRGKSWAAFTSNISSVNEWKVMIFIIFVLVGEEEIVLFGGSISRDISIKADMFFGWTSFTEIKIVYQKPFWKNFDHLHTSALGLLFKLKSHIKVRVPELACRLACYNPCGLCFQRGSWFLSFSPMVRQFPFTAPAQSATKSLAQHGWVFYHVFFLSFTNKIIWDHSLLNILDANPASKLI